MGRRKIEIRAIRDDRNRSVTFLKRKGGLFKKAYELGVLCSVDVAVIVFGNNKKLYEFSSGDINETVNRFQYYAGAPHEHKGPADFAGKGDDWEDEDEGDVNPDISPPTSHMHETPEPPGQPHHMQPYHSHRMRHETNSASPPVRHLSVHRSMTPQSQAYSRPASRMAAPPPPHRPNSSLSITQHSHYAQDSMSLPRPPQAPEFAYTSAPQYYPPARATSPHPYHNQAQADPYHHPSQNHPYHHQPVHHHTMPQMPQLSQLGLQTNNASTDRPSPHMSSSAQSPNLLQPRALAPHSSSTHSMFTPIDDSRSLLAQHWGASASSEPSRPRSADGHRRQSEVTDMSPPSGPIDPQFARQSYHERSRSASLTGQEHHGHSRSDTMQSDPKKPRLKVQIPAEDSENEESAAADSVAVTTAPTAAPPPTKGVILPPPSPSTRNPLLSAGATGPKNPFARPQLPASTSHNPRDVVETPLSALPSRVMDGNMLPSPSEIWPSAWNKPSGDNVMPSPLIFQQTPIFSSGGFSASAGEASEERKRRADSDAANPEKRFKA